ncbi:MAG: helix-turn-helix domain-containing protein [Candidatus Melainabacteria bacterium]
MNYVTTELAAEKLFTTPYTIRKYIRQGKLAAAKIGKQYLIEYEVLEAFLKQMTYKQPVEG